MPVLIVLIAMIGLVFIVVDWSKIRNALMQASWKPIPYALVATVASYTCISLNFALLSRLMGVNMRWRDLSVVGFVSIVLNHLVSGGGAAGYSVRFMLMNHHGVSMREVVTISILHFLLTSLIMIVTLPVGLLYLGLNASLSQTTIVLLAIAALLLILITLLAFGLVFWGTMRKKVVGVLVKGIAVIFRRDVRESMERFEATVALGIQAMREHPLSMVVVMILIVADWAFSLTALWFCFWAFDITLSPGQAASGFVIGTVAGVASLLPGGLGIQEASMAGIFALFGISFEKAVLASILYRAVYSIAPYLVSLGFYRQLLRRRGYESGVQEVDYENLDA
ncbi:MAG: flippase-like domain-containing protein [Anaerolineae bacterium]|jgi:uncharacterized protein (TIRG00374 family)